MSSMIYQIIKQAGVAVTILNHIRVMLGLSLG
jgi:hypothetical protein